jgi:hypothetical protein
MSKQETALAKPAREDLTLQTGGVFNDVDRLSQAIKALGEKFNLIMPGGAVGAELPQLYAVGISFVFIDPEHETYSPSDRPGIAIGKTGLDRIAQAAGVRWNPSLCGRVDDGSNPHFVEYQVAGQVLQLDGTESMISASKRIDLRAEEKSDPSTWGSDAQEMARLAKKYGREPWPQILQARQHILSLAETKAKNRAIRSLGIRTSYAPADLAKGFAIAKLQFTGHSDDPEIEREVSLMIARKALSSGSMLYGQAPQLPQRAVPRIVQAEVVKDEPDENERTDPASGNGNGHATTAEKTEPVPAPVPPKDNPEIICGPQDKEKKWPKKPCSEFSVADLRFKVAAYEKKRPDWDPKWAAKNEAELTAMKAWLAYAEAVAKELISRNGQLDLGPAKKADKVPY